MKKKILFLSLILIFSFLSVGAGCKKPWSLTGELEVNSDPSGAEIFIDGQDRNVVAPYTFDLKAGNYRLKLIKENFKDYEEEVTIKKGETTTVEAELELLNPNIHKEVYKQAQEKVAFPVVYPTYLPEGFELEGSETGKGEETEALGNLTVIYTDGGKKIRIFEGEGEMGGVESLGPVELKQGTGWVWQSGDQLGITLSESTTNYNYFVIGINSVSKEELVKIANSVIKQE